MKAKNLYFHTKAKHNRDFQVFNKQLSMYPCQAWNILMSPVSVTYQICCVKLSYSEMVPLKHHSVLLFHSHIKGHLYVKI